jgi:hypothetical protein
MGGLESGSSARRVAADRCRNNQTGFCPWENYNTKGRNEGRPAVKVRRRGRSSWMGTHMQPTHRPWLLIGRGENMDPVKAACSELLIELAAKNYPLTVNDPDRRGVVFAYSGDDWELFSQAIREAIDRVQEKRLERETGRQGRKPPVESGVGVWASMGTGRG